MQGRRRWAAARASCRTSGNMKCGRAQARASWEAHTIETEGVEEGGGCSKKTSARPRGGTDTHAMHCSTLACRFACVSAAARLRRRAAGVDEEGDVLHGGEPRDLPRPRGTHRASTAGRARLVS